MRGINICFDYENDDIPTRLCYPEKIIELPSEQFYQFKKNPHGDRLFIDRNEEFMYEGEHDEYHGLLLTSKATEDGIFVMSTPFKREVAHVPYARYYLDLEQNPALREFNADMVGAIDKIVNTAVENQVDGQYVTVTPKIRSMVNDGSFNEELLFRMLQDRDEIDEVSYDYETERIYILLAPDHVQRTDDSHLRELSDEDIEIMCAKHILWQHDAGGERADFSCCLIKDKDLSQRNLMDADFTGAKFSNTRLWKASLCFSNFDGAQFYNCDLSSVVAEECSFKNCDIRNCEMQNGIYTHSNLTGTVMRGCELYGVSLQNCCLEDTDFTDSNDQSVNRRGTTLDEQEWLDEAEEIKISMGG